MSNKRTRDIVVSGLMLFAMFLGAGNVIFPPYVGAQTGSLWAWAAVGFLITGAGLPLLGTLAVSKAGGDSNRLCDKAWPGLSKFLNVLILLMIGPLFAIPRTAATTTEMSVLPFLPEGMDQKLVFTIVSALFFLITYFLTRSSAKGLDRMGSILSPLLVLFLFITIVISIVKPIGTPAPSVVQEGMFYYGVRSGYHTMDGLGSIVMGGAVAFYITEKGYSREQLKRMLPKSALIAGILLGTVYLGYIWIGASGSAQLAGNSDRTALLSQASLLLAGRLGQVLLALIIFFACLTTAAGLVITFSEYFADLCGRRVNVKQWTVISILFSFFISLIGVEGIISLSGPVLEIIYPLVVVLILLNLFTDAIRSHRAFKGALIGSMCTLPLYTLLQISPTRQLALDIMEHFPLGNLGFVYIPFALCGFVAGFIWDWLSNHRK